jgi:quercetin dioxygenase-like cupin family protein
MRVDVDRVIVIGREGADLTIRDTELSRRHAVLRPFDGGVEVEDLGSTNGTYVDGQRIRGAVRVTGAARLRMGSSELDLQPETAAAPIAAAPAPPAGDVEPITPAADRPQPEGGRSLQKVGAVLMVVAGVVTVAVLATAFATSSSSGTKLASGPGIRLPPPALVPFVTHAGSGETVVIRGSSYSIIAPSSGTGGAFTLIKIDLHHGSEPPPHTHHRESEAFYLLRGAMTFQAGGATFHARPGDLVYLPHNVEHAYTVTSGAAQVLLLAVPGGLDRFFVALAHQPALARQLGQRFGIQPLLPGGGGAPPASAGGASSGGAPTPGSIPFITPAGKGVTVKIRGSTYTILADSIATGGAFGFLDIVLHHGSEPPAHIHHHESEVFYLLSGTMSFSAGATPFQAQAGDLVFLPRGLQHAYEVTSGTARVLLLAVPAGLEQFFKALSQNPKLAQQLGMQYGIQPGAASVTLPPIPGQGR